MKPIAMKSVSSQSTSLVNCIATSGASSSAATIPQPMILQGFSPLLPIAAMPMPPCIN